MLKWIDSFLTDRIQRVVVNGILSSWTPEKSGVPQGSVLEPTLFLSYINDLPSVVKNSHVKLFADDTKIYKAIADCRDCDALQSDLHQLSIWSKKWKLDFHPSKCSVLRPGKHVVDYDYELSDSNGNFMKVQQTNTEKDLGILIDNKLNFCDHIDKIVSGANHSVGLIRHLIRSLDKDIGYFCCYLKL